MGPCVGCDQRAVHTIPQRRIPPRIGAAVKLINLVRPTLCRKCAAEACLCTGLRARGFINFS
ncbi:hypothetical protein [Microviridae sp.]|nr:hypothetical protein [Microviridae sp.]UOF79030.1 hypothetical protein [Microviridae sp.]